MCFLSFSLGFQSQSYQYKQFLDWFPQARPPSPHHHGFVSQEASYAITVFRTNGTRVGTKPCGYCLVKSEVGWYLHFLQSEKIAGCSTLRASLSPVYSLPISALASSFFPGLSFIAVLQGSIASFIANPLSMLCLFHRLVPIVSKTQ